MFASIIFWVARRCGAAAGSIGELIIALMLLLLLIICPYWLGQHAQAKADRAIAAERITQAVQQARNEERMHAAALNEISAQHLKEDADANAETDRVLADLRSGNLRLRKQLAAVEHVPNAAAGTGGRDDAEASPGLRVADAEFLVRLGHEADDVVRQLHACQAVTAADRKTTIQESP